MLHTKFKLGLIGLACAMFTGCGSSGDNIYDNVEYLAVQQREGKNWSFVDKKGNIVAEDEFKNQPSAVVDGMFYVKEGETYSLYNIKDLKKEVLDDLTSVGVFNDGVIPVTKKHERITLVDKKGKVKATLNPVDGKEIVGCSPFVDEGMLPIMNEDGECGFADASGNIKIKPQYAIAYSFCDGVALVRKKVADDEYITSVIGKNGKELFKMKEEYNPQTSGFNCDLLPIYDKVKEVYGFINKKGEFKKLSKKVKGIGSYNADYFAYKDDDDQWGIMNMEGETIIKAKYYQTAVLKNGDFFASKKVEGKDRCDSYLLDKDGEKKVEFEDFKEIYPYDMKQFQFIGKTGKKYVLVNEKGEQIGENDFAEISSDICPAGVVESDYFNAEAVVDALTSELTDNGFGKYTIGMPATSLGIKDYDEYVWESRFRDEDLNKQGWRYSTSFFLVTDESIARRDGEYDSYYNWISRVVPNNNSKVYTIQIEATCQTSCWKDIKDSLIAKIKEKGYTLTQDNGTGIEFSGKDCRLILSSSDDGEDITITITDSKQSSEIDWTEERAALEEAPATDSLATEAYADEEYWDV